VITAPLKIKWRVQFSETFVQNFKSKTCLIYEVLTTHIQQPSTFQQWYRITYLLTSPLHSHWNIGLNNFTIVQVSIAVKFFYRDRVASPVLQPPTWGSTHFSCLLRDAWAMVGLDSHFQKYLGEVLPLLDEKVHRIFLYIFLLRHGQLFQTQIYITYI
jgi:hypothetical protein